MAKAEICAGICGFNTTVIARKDEEGIVHLDIQSDCKGVMKFADQLKEVDPLPRVHVAPRRPDHAASGAAMPHPPGLPGAVRRHQGDRDRGWAGVAR